MFVINHHFPSKKKCLALEFPSRVFHTSIFHPARARQQRKRKLEPRPAAQHRDISKKHNCDSVGFWIMASQPTPMLSTPMRNKALLREKLWSIAPALFVMGHGGTLHGGRLTGHDWRSDDFCIFKQPGRCFRPFHLQIITHTLRKENLIDQPNLHEE